MAQLLPSLTALLMPLQIAAMQHKVEWIMLLMQQWRWHRVLSETATVERY